MTWNRDTPWRQGCLLGAEAIDALGLRYAAEPEQTVVAVASHDCDLSQDPAVEPRIELMIGRLAEKDGNCTHAKNARKLHVEFSGDTAFWAQFDASAKVAVDKRALSQFLPRTDVRLSPENHAVFQMWLASRYRRSAFPDEFERRLALKEFKLAEKIAKAVKPHGELIMGVFFDVDDGRESARDGPDDTYLLDIIILHAADPDFVAAETAAIDAAQIIATAFKDKLLAPTSAWQYIELRSCEAVSESVLTYQTFKQLKRWRLDHISLAAEPQQPLPAE